MPKRKAEGGGGGGGGGGGKRQSTLLSANKDLGQNFLKNPAIVDSIVERAKVQPTDTVLEIGPGTGNLTVKLLAQAKKLVCVELDRRMVQEVAKRTEQDPRKHRLELVQGDVLKVAWPYFDVLVANLPYNISSPFLFKLLAHRPYFRSAVIMFQEEFAQRLSARPGDKLYCRLSVNCQLLAKVTQLLKVGRNNFRPPPKVDSRVVRIEVKNPPPPVNFVEWDGLVKLAFNRKNKTLRAIFTHKKVVADLETCWKTFAALRQRDAMADGDDAPPPPELPDCKALVEEIFADPKFDGKRAAKCDLDDFLALLVAFNEKGFHFTF